jgi:hypothetical protein
MDALKAELADAERGAPTAAERKAWQARVAAVVERVRHGLGYGRPVPFVRATLDMWLRELVVDAKARTVRLTIGDWPQETLGLGDLLAPPPPETAERTDPREDFHPIGAIASPVR